MPSPSPSEEIRQLGSAVREVTSSMTDVVRSEVQLAKAELKETAGHFASRGMQIGVFGAIAALGVLPFLAFMVIGLGELLNSNFWLSSLIISLVLFVVGGALAYRAYMKIKEVDYSIPETRDMLNEEANLLQRKVHQITDASKRRSA